MDRPAAVHAKIVDSIDEGKPFVVAVVLRAQGSTPRGTGVKAIIDGSGAIWGTLGGGAVEAAAQRHAITVCSRAEPLVFEVDLRGTCADVEVSICGGSMRVLLDPTAARSRDAYAAAREGIARRERGVLLTSVESAVESASESAPRLSVTVRWLPEARAADAGDPRVVDAARSCLAGEACRLVETASGVETLVEPVIPEPRLLIVGGGHIGQALAAQAHELGFAVTLVDDRPEFTRASLYPEGVSTRCGDMADEVERFPLTADTYVVLMTRGHGHDARALEKCVRSSAAYVGMIGSRRKVALVREEFIATGKATREELDRVCAPIGLDLGAVTVPEIATSIAAQLVAVRRHGRDAGRDADRSLPRS